jgi:hypothetical protein
MSKDLPKLAIRTGTDHRSNMYRAIADVHRQLGEAKAKASLTKMSLQIDGPALITHLEASLAFLAEEVLNLAKAEEDRGIVGPNA